MAPHRQNQTSRVSLPVMLTYLLLQINIAVAVGWTRAGEQSTAPVLALTMPSPTTFVILPVADKKKHPQYSSSNAGSPYRPVFGTAPAHSTDTMEMVDFSTRTSWHHNGDNLIGDKKDRVVERPVKRDIPVELMSVLSISVVSAASSPSPSTTSILSTTSTYSLWTPGLPVQRYTEVDCFATIVGRANYHPPKKPTYSPPMADMATASSWHVIGDIHSGPFGSPCLHDDKRRDLPGKGDPQAKDPLELPELSHADAPEYAEHLPKGAEVLPGQDSDHPKGFVISDYPATLSENVTRTTHAPEPLASCSLKGTGLTTEFAVWGKDWDHDKLDGAGGHGSGKRLHDRIKACMGNISRWEAYSRVAGTYPVTESPSYDFMYQGATTIWQKACIRHAIRMSGAPDGPGCHADD